MDDLDDKLPITTSRLKQLITEELEIDPGVLWFIANRYDGFHRLDSATSTSYILANSIYILVWRFDRRHGVSGVFLERLNPGLFADQIPYHLKLFSKYYKVPGLLAFVVCHITCDVMDSLIECHGLRGLQDIESITSFGPDDRHVSLHRYDTMQIMSWLKSIAGFNISTANDLRWISMFKVALDDIFGDFSDTRSHSADDDSLGFLPAVRLLTSRITARENYRIYLKERADQISRVAFALLTHEDASVSMDIAKSSQALAEHSTYIAECAKRDSSGMKTITIITMAFLPATFFATLFAVPTLDWKGESTVTGQFWIYWAFTLPTTALVFLLWIFLTNRAQLLNLFRTLLKDRKNP
ncbi:hypothetical protein F5Y14DRAFT_403359 [Nemania sp. NC0429]|nr:hypothetical protein F5Y14DRAFT_403359 [Nemania sp. NC0429]